MQFIVPEHIAKRTTRRKGKKTVTISIGQDVAIRNLLEEIIQGGYNYAPEVNLMHLYLGVSNVFPVIETNEKIEEELNLNSLSNWPKHLSEFWLSLNKVFLNPELEIEKKQFRIYNMIKNKYLNLCGIRFPRRA